MPPLMPPLLLLDPFALLGVTPDSTPAEVRKAYYAMSLWCHPDKGGDAADMACVHAAYKFVSAQAEAVNRTETVESLEARFAEFCRLQTEAPPRFRDIVDCDEEREIFHRDFLILPPNGESRGYGALMARSEYASAVTCPAYRDVVLVTNDGPETAETADDAAKAFARDVVVYVEPQAACTLRGDAFSSSVDLSGSDAGRVFTVDAPVAMADYVEAHNTVKEALPDPPAVRRTLEELVEERGRLDQALREGRNAARSLA